MRTGGVERNASEMLKIGVAQSADAPMAIQRRRGARGLLGGWFVGWFV